MEVNQHTPIYTYKHIHIMVFQGRLKGVSRDFQKFQGFLKEVQREVSKLFQVCFRVFQGSYKNVSRKFQVYFKKVLRKIEDWSKGFTVLQGSLKGVSRKFQGFLGVLSKFQWCLK